jgi:hypothetical protein
MVDRWRITSVVAPLEAVAGMGLRPLRRNEPGALAGQDIRERTRRGLYLDGACITKRTVMRLGSLTPPQESGCMASATEERWRTKAITTTVYSEQPKIIGRPGTGELGPEGGRITKRSQHHRVVGHGRIQGGPDDETNPASSRDRTGADSQGFSETNFGLGSLGKDEGQIASITPFPKRSHVGSRDPSCCFGHK